MINAWGGAFFDMDWQPQITSQPWKEAVSFYVTMMNNYAPPGATANGFNENQALFSAGHCAIWVDATSAAGRLYNPETSQVVDKIGYAQSPGEITDKGVAWLWAWALAIPSTTHKADAAKSFVKWATSKDYVKLVAETGGVVTSPPGTRKSTYTAEYLAAAPFAEMTAVAIETADQTNANRGPLPYSGISFVIIPEYQGIGTMVAQTIAGVVAGQTSLDDALQSAQDEVVEIMTQAGYIQ